MNTKYPIHVPTIVLRVFFRMPAIPKSQNETHILESYSGMNTKFIVASNSPHPLQLNEKE